VLKAIGYFCILIIAVFVLAEALIQFVGRRVECDSPSCPNIANLVVLIVGGVPIAMPTVLSVTMAIGASKLSKKKAIVTRLSAVEELAGKN
jgi:H+-transporting ATPase